LALEYLQNASDLLLYHLSCYFTSTTSVSYTSRHGLPYTQLQCYTAELSLSIQINDMAVKAQAI